MAVNLFEELVSAYFQSKGYFVMHNIPYALPPNNSAKPPFKTGPSEIDLIAIAPAKQKKPVYAVSCKGYLSGIDFDKAVDAILDTDGGKLFGARDAWRHFRELACDEWAGAFRGAVQQKSGSSKFIHVTAVISAKGNRDKWCENSDFKSRMNDTRLEIRTLKQMWDSLKKDDGKAIHHRTTFEQLALMLSKAT